jgi:hypothetical protein
MPRLLQVRDLDEDLGPGSRTLTVIGLTPGRGGLLYHHLFSSQAPGFVSEPKEVQEALQTVTWLLDSGFDAVAVWRTIWEQHQHLVSRIYPRERKVAVLDRAGPWHEGDSAQAQTQVRQLACVETSMEVKGGKPVRPKKQPVKVKLATCPLPLTRLHQCAPKGARAAGDA